VTDHRSGEGPSDDESRDDLRDTLAARHHRFGWWSLVVFVGVGLVLESLLGFRTPLLVDADVETRRTMFRLTHAHGALLALVNLALAASLRSGALAAEHSRRASRLVLAGSVALPAGFFLGGVWFHQADPGLGIVLVPVGALALVAGLVTIARRS